MGIEVTASENEAENIIANSFDEVFGEEAKEEIKDAIVEEAAEDKEIDEVEETDSEEEATEESPEAEEDDSTEEVEDEKEIEQDETDLNESLRGVFSKEHISLISSLEDSELRDKFIEEGKKSRSELDRKRLEFGEGKKLVETLDETVKVNGLNYNRQQYADVIKNFMGFDALFAKDPQQAIETLAKQANIDLNTLGSKTVQEDDLDDYRTPEEIEMAKRLETLERREQQRENQLKQQEQLSVQQEINDFASTKDSDGNLKYPYFDKVRANMGLFFNDNNPDMTMERAYNKALMLDDELIAKRDADLLRKVEMEKKARIEKAKKLKKQSVRSSSINASKSDPRAKTLDAVDAWYAASN